MSAFSVTRTERPAWPGPVADWPTYSTGAVEYTEMYPGMAKTAREEGFEEIADWFETLAKAEKSHAGRFQSLLDSIN